MNHKATMLAALFALVVASTTSALVRPANIAMHWAPGSSTPPPPVTGLVAAYGFEGSGTTVADSSGNGHDGTIVGATRVPGGKFGSALDFDGTDDLVDLGNLDIVGGSGLTISLWMKADTFGISDARLVSKATGVQEDDHYWMVSTFSSKSVRFRLKAGGSTTTLISGNDALSIGPWIHVAMIYDGAEMVIYADGVEVGSATKTGVIDADASVPAAIGNQPQNGKSFDGILDEVRIYNRALTPAEIQSDMITPVIS